MVFVGCEQVRLKILIDNNRMVLQANKFYFLGCRRGGWETDLRHKLVRFNQTNGTSLGTLKNKVIKDTTITFYKTVNELFNL